jgi:hypothetical protein
MLFDHRNASTSCVYIRIADVDPPSLLRDVYGHLTLLEAIKASDPDKAQEVFANTLEAWLAITRGEFAQHCRRTPRKANAGVAAP